MDFAARADALKAYVRDVPDFPKKGIVFKDITTLLKEPRAFRQSLDLFIATLRDLAMAAKRGDTARFLRAPRHAPRRRLDETRAARNPVLRWSARSAESGVGNR